MIFEEVKIVNEMDYIMFVQLPLWIGCVAFGMVIFVLILYAMGVLWSPNLVHKFLPMGILFMLMAGGGYVYTTTVGKVSSAERVPMSTIDNKIHVDGNKVTIDPLEGKYSTTRTFNDKQTEPQIYEFKYDEFYNQGWLIDSGGHEIKLDKDDTEYLRGKQK